MKNLPTWKYANQAYRSYHKHPEAFMEKVIYNYITTNRSIRELSGYYQVPRTTLHRWLKKSSNLVPFDLYKRYHMTAKMHKRRLISICNNNEEYVKLDIDGPLD